MSLLKVTTYYFQHTMGTRVAILEDCCAIRLPVQGMTYAQRSFVQTLPDYITTIALTMKIEAS
jgi:hypothetical protein